MYYCAHYIWGIGAYSPDLFGNCAILCDLEHIFRELFLKKVYKNILTI